MYKTIIEFKRDTSEEILKRLKLVCEEAFDNRAGKADIKTEDEYTISFEGDDNLYMCLNLGNIGLYKTKGFVEYLSSWNWIDTDDRCESCDLIEVYSRPIYDGKGNICQKISRENKLLSI